MNPIYQQARFWRATPDTAHLPPDRGREVAIAGRSNAGKSSAINAVCQQRALARTSKTPGRTQQIVFFSLDDDHNLVDLPGYGYAKVPEKLKRQWYQLVEGYLAERQALQGLILVMDVRHPLTEFDEQMLNWAAHAGMPVHILLTKADKLKRGAANNALFKVQKALDERFPGAEAQLFSASSRQGVETVHEVLDEWFGFGEGD